MFSIESLYPVMILMNVVVGLLLLYFFWGKNDRSSMLWAVASFIFAIAIVLILLGDSVHPVLRYFVSNFATSFAFFLYVKSIRNLFSEQSTSLWLGGFISLVYASYVFWLVLSKQFYLVPIVVGGGYLLIHSWAALSLLKLNRQRNNPYIKFFIYLFFTGGVVWLLRGIFSQVFKFSFAPDPQFVNWLFMVLITVLVLLRQTAYLLLRFGRTQEEKEIIESLNSRLNQTIEQKNVLIKTLSTSVKANQVGGAVAGIVHELTQPLAAIGINTELLIQSTKKSGEFAWQNEVLGYIHQDNMRASGIISRLRNFYKKGAENFSTFDLVKLTRRVIALAMPSYLAAKVTLKPVLAQSVCVSGDEGQIEMVIMNLLTNALNAMESQSIESYVLIDLRIEGERAVLDVMDNGCGIAADQQADIFNLFHTTKTQGMGVGLWLSREIMENHDGQLTLLPSKTSVTCFQLTMPLVMQDVT